MNKSELLKFAKGGTPPPPAVFVTLILNETTGSPEIFDSCLIPDKKSWCIVVCQTKAAYDALDTTVCNELFAGEHERLTGQREGQAHFIKVIAECEAQAFKMLLAGEDITSEHRPFWNFQK